MQDASLIALKAELQTYFTRAVKEKKDFGDALSETKSAIVALQKQVDAQDIAAAGRIFSSDPGEDFRKSVEENDSVGRLLRDKKGAAIVTFDSRAFESFARKTTITDAAVGTATSGVLAIQRLAGLTREPTQQLTVRDLFTANPTTFQVIDFVKVATPMTIASPVAEAAVNPENQVTFATVSERVKTIATGFRHRARCSKTSES